MNNFDLKYHLMPAKLGWLNDPNGLCQYQGTYHIFYQYSAKADGTSNKCWGHYSTKDFQHYKDEGIALYPDIEEDKNGVYSGCCLVEDGLHLFYTGNVKLPGNHDYIHSGRLSNTIHVYSPDGIHFQEKEILLTNKDYPNNLTNHIRDPKVFKKEDTYYMVLGARDNHDVGCVLVYTSKDLYHWSYSYRITSTTPFGYMWECPDLITLNSDTFLITCPQGITQQGYLYENENQNGYFKINDKIAYDYETLDHGYDFYAPQSFTDEKGRRILIAWMGLPDSIPLHPTIQDGWQMALSLPREIKNINHKLYQFPIQEILDLGTEEEKLTISPISTTISKTCRLHISNIHEHFQLRMNNLEITYSENRFCLSFHNDTTNRIQRNILISSIDELDIFLDTSSIEIFINHGEKAMTSRYYDSYNDLSLTSTSTIKIIYKKVDSFQYE